MSRYTGKDAKPTVDGLAIENIETTVNDEAIMEETDDTSCETMTVGSRVLIVTRSEPVALKLTGSTTAFHNTATAIRGTIRAGKQVAITFAERAGKSWSNITATITKVSQPFGPKKHTQFSFDWQAEGAWTYPTS